MVPRESGPGGQLLVGWQFSKFELEADFSRVWDHVLHPTQSKQYKLTYKIL